MDTQKKKSALVLVVIAILGTLYYFAGGGSSQTSGNDAAVDPADSSVSGIMASAPANDPTSNVEIPYRVEDKKSDIIAHMGYTLSYNQEYRVPNWVAYELLSSELYSGNRSREDAFEPDPKIKGRQAYDSDYIGSGYDRGHMAPAGDMKWSSQAMKECFYLSNVCPQNHNLNSGAWNDLEKQVRYEAKYYGAVWVACGPIFESNRPKHIGEDYVMVPDSFFKALLAKKRDGSGYVAIGFIFPNEVCERNLMDYCMTVDELEEKTGMDFFYNLDQSQQDKAESTMDAYKDWRIKDEILRD